MNLFKSIKIKRARKLALQNIDNLSYIVSRLSMASMNGEAALVQRLLNAELMKVIELDCKSGVDHDSFLFKVQKSFWKSLHPDWDSLTLEKQNALRHDRAQEIRDAYFTL